jgi:hypothetical protein
MTLDEYAKQVGDALRNAHNSKDKAALEAAFKAADAKLDQFFDARRKKFWENALAAMNAGRWRVEDQANSSLLTLMQAIQTGLAARQGK